jgi:peptide/nickel transport system permease protein
MAWTLASAPADAGGARLRGLAVVFGVLYAVVLLARFLSPYAVELQNRDTAFAPPTPLHVVGADGRWHRPFVYRITPVPGSFDAYEEDRSIRYPVRLFVPSAPYRLLGLFQFEHRLFGVDEPARLFLLGADQLGRDQLSRLLVGAEISLVAGPLAAALTLVLAVALGGSAGFFGGRIDDAVMRLVELSLVLPWLYLLFAVRSALPLHMEADRVFLLLIVVIGLVGWARPARLVRGVVLSARERDYVTAARSLGASTPYLLFRHVLPQASSVVLVQAALLVPQYILAEVTLSFLGLGVAEPVPSWGNMLATLQRYNVLASYWWLFAPAVALVPVTLLYHALAQALQRRVPAGA